MKNKIIYWVSTLWLALGMVATGAGQIFGAREVPGGADMLSNLGYPPYLLGFFGIWKLLGAVVILIPGYEIHKEWAYAGFFFLTTGGIFSHIASGDQVNEIFPALLLLLLTMTSWYFRPSNRKISSVAQVDIHQR